MDSSLGELDAATFFAARQIDNQRMLRGAELQQVFWRLRGLEKELERQHAFWKATNDTLAQAFEQVRSAEAELQRNNALLQASLEQLQALTSRLQNELALARHIQQSLLPPRQASWVGPQVVCACVPAYEVGGDFYAYHALEGQRFALAVGDVSEKGMAAALLMAISLAVFDADVPATLSPAALLAHLDRELVRYTEATRQHCALCYVEIDGTMLRSVNAGGIPPFIRRASGAVERLDVNGVPLGLGLGTVTGYDVVTAELAPGDLVILTSDGVVEATAADRELFGFGRLEQAIAHGPAAAPHAMLEHLLGAVKTFVGAAEPHDDLTIVVCQL